MRTVLVAAGVIIEDGRVLLSQRKPGAHLAGMWEFPGGKVDDGEDPRAALSRELKEELGIDTVVGDVIEVTFHHYADAEKAVLLLFFQATRVPTSPAPQALDVAAFKWAAAADFDPSQFPPADVAILKKISARL